MQTDLGQISLMNKGANIMPYKDSATKITLIALVFSTWSWTGLAVYTAVVLVVYYLERKYL